MVKQTPRTNFIFINKTSFKLSKGGIADLVLRHNPFRRHVNVGGSVSCLRGKDVDYASGLPDCQTMF